MLAWHIAQIAAEWTLSKFMSCFQSHIEPLHANAADVLSVGCGGTTEAADLFYSSTSLANSFPVMLSSACRYFAYHSCNCHKHLTIDAADVLSAGSGGPLEAADLFYEWRSTGQQSASHIILDMWRHLEAIKPSADFDATAPPKSDTGTSTSGRQA